MNLMILRKRILFAFILSVFVNLVFAQVTIKRNLNAVIGDTTKFSSADEGRLSIDSYNFPIGLTVKNNVTDPIIGNRFLYGIRNFQNSETLPLQKDTLGLGSPWVRVGMQTSMSTRRGQFINSIFNIITEKPNSILPLDLFNSTETTAIINQIDTITNNLNGVYNRVTGSSSLDVKLFRNYMDQRSQTSNIISVAEGLYNDFEMGGNRNNYGVLNVMKSSNGYAPGPGFNNEVAGFKNIFKKSTPTTDPNTLLASPQITAGLINDMTIFGGYQSNGYGVLNLIKYSQVSQSNLYGVKTSVIPDTGVNINSGNFANRAIYGIYSEIDSAVGSLPNSYAGFFKGKVSVNGSLVVGSDVSLKENIKDYKGGVDLVKAMLPKSYNLKAEKDDVNRKIHTGFVAQDVELVAPDLVYTIRQPGKTNIKQESVEKTRYEYIKDVNGNLSLKPVKYIETNEVRSEDPSIQLKAVNYIEIIPILLQAIKEQQVIIEQLQADVEKLKKK